MKEIDERLAEIKAKIKEKERLMSTLSKLNTQKREAEEKSSSLSKQLKKEKDDVDKLEGLSLSSFLHTVLGNKVEKLEKEKREFISAKLNYDTVNAEVERLERDLEAIRKRILGIGGVEEEYNQLLREKEAVLMNSTNAYKEKLDNIIEKEATLADENKELNEALQAGNELLSSLNSIQESLQSAGNWGTWDMFGGGIFSTMAKHSHIDDAQAKINNTQYLIKKFHRELQDIGGEMYLDIDMSSFLKFADYFFDGLFADITVQSRINESKDRVGRAIDKVERSLNEIYRKYNSNESELEKLRKEKVTIIEEA